MIEDDYDPHPCHDDDTYSWVDLSGGTISHKELKHGLRRAFHLTLLERLEDLTAFDLPKCVHRTYNATVDFVLDKKEEFTATPTAKRVATHFNSMKKAMYQIFGSKQR